MTKNLLARVTSSKNGVVENEMFWHQWSTPGINMETHKNELMFEAFYCNSQEIKKEAETLNLQVFEIKKGNMR